MRARPVATTNYTTPCVQGDPLRIKVLLNPVSNAIKFTPEHGEGVSMCSRVTSRTRIPCLGHRPALLGPCGHHLQVVCSGRRRPANSQPGTGLGLTIARHLTRLHDGDPGSRAGRLGAVFIVKLPVVRARSSMV